MRRQKGSMLMDTATTRERLPSGALLVGPHLHRYMATFTSCPRDREPIQCVESTSSPAADMLTLNYRALSSNSPYT